MAVGVTNARAGQINYMDGMKMDKSCRMLQATCAIPMLFPAIEIDGQYYYDGGVCEPITIHKAEADGYHKHIIILTREKTYIKEKDKSNELAAKILKRRFPNMVKPLLERHDYYNAEVAYCNDWRQKDRHCCFGRNILWPAWKRILINCRMAMIWVINKPCGEWVRSGHFAD